MPLFCSVALNDRSSLMSASPSALSSRRGPNIASRCPGCSIDGADGVGCAVRP